MSSSRPLPHGAPGGSAKTKNGRPTVLAEQEPHLHPWKGDVAPSTTLVAHQPRAL